MTNQRAMCHVPGCGFHVHARGMCRRHYDSWWNGYLAEADALRDDPVVCLCPEPTPDPIGECGGCGRLVVTYAHGARDRFQAQWPEEWNRAVALGLTPAR